MESFWHSWRQFWFRDSSCVPISLFRILLGLLILQMLLVHTANAWLDWYGVHSVASFSAVRQYYWHSEPRFDLFLLLPESDFYRQAFMYFFVLVTCFLTIGLFTRVSAILVFLCLLSLHHHQPYNINGGDTILRLTSMSLCFSNAGRAISIDRLIDRFQHIEPLSVICSPWAQRLIQVQVAIAYWNSFSCKISGAQWLDGTAVYYATRLDDLIRLTPPLLLNSLFFCKLLSWTTIIIEGSMFIFVWFKELRYFILTMCLLLHLGIDFSINLPVFEWAFMASFVTFVYPEDLSRLMDRLKHYAIRLFGRPAALSYDCNSIMSLRLVSVIQGLDIFERLRYFPKNAVEGNEPSDLVRKAYPLSLHQRDGVFQGFELWRRLSFRLPLLWFLVPLIWLIPQTSGRLIGAGTKLL